MVQRSWQQCLQEEWNHLCIKYNDTATVYFRMKNFDKCIKFCRQACKIDKENEAQSKFIFKGFERMKRAHKGDGGSENCEIGLWKG